MLGSKLDEGTDEVTNLPTNWNKRCFRRSLRPSRHSSLLRILCLLRRIVFENICFIVTLVVSFIEEVVRWKVE